MTIKYAHPHLKPYGELGMTWCNLHIIRCHPGFLPITSFLNLIRLITQRLHNFYILDYLHCRSAFSVMGMYEVLSFRTILSVIILIPMCIEHPCLPHQGRTRIFLSLGLQAGALICMSKRELLLCSTSIRVKILRRYLLFLLYLRRTIRPCE